MRIAETLEVVAGQVSIVVNDRERLLTVIFTLSEAGHRVKVLLLALICHLVVGAIVVLEEMVPFIFVKGK